MAGPYRPALRAASRPLAIPTGRSSLLTRRWRGVDSNFRFRDALSSPTAALVAPPDWAVRDGSLNGRLTTPIGGGPATARLTRREDRSAQLGRGPKTLVIGRQR